jgi:hypothetical protein
VKKKIKKKNLKELTIKAPSPHLQALPLWHHHLTCCLFLLIFFLAAMPSYQVCCVACVKALGCADKKKNIVHQEGFFLELSEGKCPHLTSLCVHPCSLATSTKGFSIVIQIIN